MPATFLASETRMLWRMLEEHRQDAEAIFAAVGLNPDLRNIPEARYDMENVYQLWGSAIDNIGIPNIGLQAARFYRITDAHSLMIAFLSSPTLRMALERLIRFQKIVNTDLAMNLFEADGLLHLDAAAMHTTGNIELQIENWRSALIMELCREGINSGLNPAQVSFTFAEPADTGDYYAVFKCPVVFAAPSSRLSFSLADADSSLSTANRDLLSSSDAGLTRILNSLSLDNIADRIKLAIIDALPSGPPSDTLIAKKLHISVRSMQRKLAEIDTSFTQVLNTVRQQLAESYIANPNIPVTEISYLLGFSDVSSFSRAFKRWTGTAPVAYREQLAG